MALFEMAALGELLGEDELDTGRATVARSRAENYFRVELGLEFASAKRTFSDRVRAAQTFQQLSSPLTEVASVSVDGVHLVNGTDWEMTNRGVSCPSGFGSWSSINAGRRPEWVTLEIGYTSGFDEVPSELSDWGVYLASLSYRMGSIPGVVSRTIAVDGVSESETYATGGGPEQESAFGLPADVLKSLRARYASGRRRARSVRLGR